MRPCPRCGTANPDDYKFCQQCGRALVTPPPAEEAPPPDATVRWASQPSGERAAPRRAVTLDGLFAGKDRLVIGRASDCDVRLDHPSVSRYHALVERLPQGLRLRDLRSVNGVFVAGHRIGEPVFVREQEHVGIGPFLFALAGGVLYSLDNSRSLRLEARRLEKIVRLRSGEPRKLLDGVNLVVEPGEFVSLLGPSGSGKSTLMDCLNGRRRATGGQVLANGEDFYRHYDNFRQSLGYVPQKDIVHGQLTVYRALYYTARLRLPADTDPAEMNGRIEEVLEEMGLGPHRETLVVNLSGGQIKRVSLGAELLARPCLLYIDEATSGLDAGTEARMMRLFRRLADEGRSLVCITHNVDNVDRCHLVLILARGRLVYYGPPAEAPSHFGVRRLSEVYDRLAEKEPDAWQDQFLQSEAYGEFVEKRLAVPGGAPAPEARGDVPFGTVVRPSLGGFLTGLAPEGPAARSRLPPLADRVRRLAARYGRFRERLAPLLDSAHQLRVLTRRYLEMVWSDRRSLRLLLLQAPIVATFLLVGFANKPYQQEVPVLRHLSETERGALRAVDELGEAPRGVPQLEKVRQVLLDERFPMVPQGLMTDPRYTYMLLNILAISVFWFGCNNASKEIVKEEAIYGRERAFNLRIPPYLLSKFVVLGAISAVQVLLLMLVIYGVLEGLHALGPAHQVPPPQYRLGYPAQYGVLVLLAVCGVAAGLLLSACVASPDRSSALLPYVLIPQIILGGAIIAVRGEPLRSLAMTLSPVYWGYQAIHRGTDRLPAYHPMHTDHEYGVGLACTALAVQTVVLLALTAWFLRRKDVGQG